MCMTTAKRIDIILWHVVLYKHIDRILTDFSKRDFLMNYQPLTTRTLQCDTARHHDSLHAIRIISAIRRAVMG